MKLLILAVSLLAFQTARANLVCTVCEDAVGFLEKELGSSATKEKVKEYLDKECDDLTHGNAILDGLCKVAAEAAISDLLPLIVKNEPPQKACQQVHLCRSKKAVFKANRAQFADSPACTACKGLIGVIDSELTNPTVEAAIQKDLLAICGIVPAAEREECKTVINSYFSELWDEIVQLLNADKLCTEIGLCKPGGMWFQRFNQKGNPWGTVECNFCKTLFQFVVDNLVNANMQQQMENSLKAVCKDIPNQDYQQKCSAMVDKYGKMLFKELQAILQPTHVCPILHMCSSSK